MSASSGWWLGRILNYLLEIHPVPAGTIGEMMLTDIQKRTWRFKVRPLIDYGTHLGVTLNNGEVALVDLCDKHVVEGFNWTARPYKGGTYAHGWKHGRSVPLGAFIIGHLADHKNGDTLDNRRRNLRPVTWAQNCRNRRIASNNTSGFKGVSFRSDRGTWMASIRVNGKLKKLGTFETAKEAAWTYDAAAEIFFGEFAWLNFPYDAAANSAGCYDLAIEAMRKKHEQR